MGTPSTTKFLKNSNGSLAEEAALVTSAGAGDANKIPALNASGKVDVTMLNATVASAGAGDAGKLTQLDGSGRLDITVMPVGVGADTALIATSEALAAGDLVNVWNNAGTANVRKADNTSAGKEAHGFVLAAVSGGANATVYFEGGNTGKTGLTGGVVYLGTAGGTVATPPTASGSVVQRVGYATSATVLNFDAGVAITLA